MDEDFGEDMGDDVAEVDTFGEAGGEGEEERGVMDIGAGDFGEEEEEGFVAFLKDGLVDRDIGG